MDFTTKIATFACMKHYSKVILFFLSSFVHAPIWGITQASDVKDTAIAVNVKLLSGGDTTELSNLGERLIFPEDMNDLSSVKRGLMKFYDVDGKVTEIYLKKSGSGNNEKEFLNSSNIFKLRKCKEGDKYYELHVKVNGKIRNGSQGGDSAHGFMALFNPKGWPKSIWIGGSVVVGTSLVVGVWAWWTKKRPKADNNDDSDDQNDGKNGKKKKGAAEQWNSLPHLW